MKSPHAVIPGLVPAYIQSDEPSCCANAQSDSPSFLWIPVTPVITAGGCADQGDENDGGGRNVPLTKAQPTGRPQAPSPNPVVLPKALRRPKPPHAVILAEPSRPAEGGATGFGGNPEERAACLHHQHPSCQGMAMPTGMTGHARILQQCFNSTFSRLYI